ncbi:bifunctional adenosylcobinamide kinase/adenosylcobinamide-phosphate guanylyltransferase [Sporosarcina sp. YIM B06819]|uniref:bifunctional adenosylcobinamide kinase/adenosylcobinamide-phosphate guanylyltransferase n=1 Tax=Sporosarcina sp. YIM B06819 TaxID=3081769 RepID=UPI00298BD842|nr:bifunctional adenosylcobinamide kinase/adenosylcobinamide-phosphate guanylyltransferase [Sporosarcina sp. YIM B06819]
MHIIIGGAYNGKRDYVRTMLAGREAEWFEGVLPKHSDTCQVMVVAGIEKWLAETKLSEVEAIDQVLAAIDGRDVIVVLTDIGRGIVPINAQQRQLRDTCGRLYQQLMAEADEVTRIWYGLAQTLT